jgi:predicted SprT family Zn-dependent metalloprotease
MDKEKYEKLKKITALANRLIAEFNLDEYSFHFNETYKALGRCNPTEKIIELSRRWALHLSLEEVEDTLRHEIAHALASKLWKHHGHGPAWKKACAIAGAKPEAKQRLSGNYKEAYKIVIEDSAKWAIICVECGNHTYYIRKPRKTLSRYMCRHCSGELALKRLV